MTGGDKILVVGPSWVGDMVMAQALYKLLRQSDSAAEIQVVAPPWSLPVLARMPEVARGIELAVAHGELGLQKRVALGRRLATEGFKRAIVLPRSAKAALVPWVAGIPRRTGFRGEWRYGLLNDVRRLPASLDQTVKRFVALGQPRDTPPPTEALPVALYPRLDRDDDNVARLRAEHGFEVDARIVALMPGAEYGAAKRWPAAHYGALAAMLARTGVKIVVLGSAKERPIGEEVAAAAGDRVRNLCGRTSLADVVDLLAIAAAAVSNDSGLLHVAAAAGTPVVAIYGSSSPTFTPPLTTAAAVVSLALECSPCFARECPLGHLRCLRELSPTTVLAALEPLLTPGGARRQDHSNRRHG